jgi:hypothetical protein
MSLSVNSGRDFIIRNNMNINVTVEEIILNFLSSKVQLHSEYTFKHHILETDLSDWGSNRFGILHTPGTYSRAFRRIREHKLYKDLFDIKEVKTKGREKCFSIVKLQ